MVIPSSLHLLYDADLWDNVVGFGGHDEVLCVQMSSKFCVPIWCGPKRWKVLETAPINGWKDVPPAFAAPSLLAESDEGTLQKGDGVPGRWLVGFAMGFLLIDADSRMHKCWLLPSRQNRTAETSACECPGSTE